MSQISPSRGGGDLPLKRRWRSSPEEVEETIYRSKRGNTCKWLNMASVKCSNPKKSVFYSGRDWVNGLCSGYTKSPDQDGDARFWDILAPLWCSQRKWRCHLCFSRWHGHLFWIFEVSLTQWPKLLCLLNPTLYVFFRYRLCLSTKVKSFNKISVEEVSQTRKLILFWKTQM